MDMSNEVQRKPKNEEEDLEEGELKDDDEELKVDDAKSNKRPVILDDSSSKSSTLASPKGSREFEKQENLHNDEEDLEEGELKDDDDDDEEFDGDDVTVNQKSTNPSENSPSSSSLSSQKESREHSSSKSSSIERSHHTSSNHNNSSNYDNNSYERQSKIHLSKTRFMTDERYRHVREREKEDPSEKAAKLISMRTKLLEARSREIELKFLKNKGKVSPPPPSPSLLNTVIPKNLKMTVASPSISYSENPNPAPAASILVSSPKKLKSKSSKSEEKEKKIKKKKKSSHKKHKKHKSEGNVKKGTNEIKDNQEQYHNVNDNQGPRTPPDNHVTTLEDEQIEWPSYLIRMTVAQPAISYSVNPKSVLETYEDDKRETINTRTAKTTIYEDLNSDYTWYYNYFLNSFEMDHNQAQHQALTAIITTGSYSDEMLEKWLTSRGLSKIISSESDVQKQRVTVIQSQREIVMPNGHILPLGTIQKIVHPYPLFTARKYPRVWVLGWNAGWGAA